MQKRTFTDQIQREVEISFPPKRIISIVPSQTELLFSLDLDIEIIGITKFCVHPAEKFKMVTKVGGTKKLNLDKIRELKPDLIIANKEENNQEEIEILMKEFPVWMSDIYTLNDALKMILQVGAISDKVNESENLVSKIKRKFENINLSGNSFQKVAYFIWKDPYMIAGKHTFIDDIIKICGFSNAFDLERYPEISLEVLKETNPDLIFLSSEPYPFKERHVEEFQKICPQSKVVIVDGEMFSWYGSRLLKAAAYLQVLVNEVNTDFAKIKSK